MVNRRKEACSIIQHFCKIPTYLQNVGSKSIIILQIYLFNDLLSRYVPSSYLFKYLCEKYPCFSSFSPQFGKTPPQRWHPRQKVSGQSTVGLQSPRPPRAARPSVTRFIYKEKSCPLWCNEQTTVRSQWRKVPWIKVLCVRCDCYWFLAEKCEKNTRRFVLCWKREQQKLAPNGCVLAGFLKKVFFQSRLFGYWLEVFWKKFSCLKRFVSSKRKVCVILKYFFKR